MKRVRGVRKLEQATSSTPIKDCSANTLSDEARAEVDRIELALDSIFDDALIERRQSSQILESATGDALAGAPGDESSLQQQLDRFQRENRRLLFENAVLREELKKYPMLDDPVLLELVDRLTENDRHILTAMWEMAATKAKPESASDIVRAALAKGDSKTAFDRLKIEGLVDASSGRSGGYWLTERGRHVAIALTLQEP